MRQTASVSAAACAWVCVAGGVWRLGFEGWSAGVVCCAFGLGGLRGGRGWGGGSTAGGRPGVLMSMSRMRPYLSPPRLSLLLFGAATEAARGAPVGSKTGEVRTCQRGSRCPARGCPSAGCRRTPCTPCDIRRTTGTELLVSPPVLAPCAGQRDKAGPQQAHAAAGPRAGAGCARAGLAGRAGAGAAPAVRHREERAVKRPSSSSSAAGPGD